jgi:protein tyrosine phosphatase
MVVFDHIIDNIYLGDIDAVQMKNIDVVINVSGQRYEELPDRQYYHLDMSTVLTDTIVRFDTIMWTINPSTNVLIHCQAGISRSPTLVLYYLMKYHNYTLRNAYSYTVKKRSQHTAPNFGYYKQLRQYDYQINKAHSMEIEDYFKMDMLI